MIVNESVFAIKDVSGRVVSSILSGLLDESSHSPTVGLFKAIPIPPLKNHFVIWHDDEFCYDDDGDKIPYVISTSFNDMCFAEFLSSLIALKAIIIDSAYFLEEPDNLHDRISSVFECAFDYRPESPEIAKQQADIIDMIINSAKITSALSVRSALNNMSFDEAKRAAYKDYINSALCAVEKLISA